MSESENITILESLIAMMRRHDKDRNEIARQYTKSLAELEVLTGTLTLNKIHPTARKIHNKLIDPEARIGFVWLMSGGKVQEIIEVES